MPKPKQSPSDVLRDALATLGELKREMPQSIVLIGQCERQVKHVIEAYEDQRRTLDELRESTRKPPQRVMMRARRKPTNLPRGASISPLTMRQADQEYDDEAEHDAAQTFETPDGTGSD